MSTYSILYNGNAEIDTHMLNSIIQSVVTFTDDIWINSNITLSKKMPTATLEHAQEIISLLEDKEIIKRWNYPNFEINKTSCSATHKNSPVAIDANAKSKPKGIINEIPFDQYEEINNQINKIFLTHDNLLPTTSLTYQPIRNLKNEIETTSKVIAIRKEYWSVAIASLLGANSLLIAPEYKNMWCTTPEKFRYPLVEKEIISHCLENFCFVPDLTVLKPEDIIKLHNINGKFKEKICKLSKNISTEIQCISDIESIGQAMQDSIWEYVDEVNSGRKSGTIKNIGYTISSIFIPVISALPFVDDYIKWLSTKRKYGYIFFLSELKKINR